MTGVAKPVMDRLFSRLAWHGECLVWTGVPTSGGYAQVGESVDGKRRVHLAHRVVYERTLGPIPDGLLVCHTCDNPPCCNPEHLFLGTPRDNMLDKIAKGRAMDAGRGSWVRCLRGHEFTTVNTYTTPNGRRQCRACRTIRRATKRKAGQ